MIRRSAHIWYGAPRSVVPFAVLGNVVDHSDVVEAHLADLTRANDGSRAQVARLDLVVLRDAPHELLRPVGLVVVLDERDAARHVLRDGLLAQDVLARREGPAHDVRLDGDWERDDDRVDIGAREQRVEARVRRAIVVHLRRRTQHRVCGSRELGRALLRSRVDRPELRRALWERRDGGQMR